MELLPTIDALHWFADDGPGDPRRRARPAAAALPEAEARALHLRAARRGRRDRALELPVVDPVRRGRDRADGRQRRRAQAGVADAADRRSGSRRSSSAPGCPRASCGPCTAAARSARRSSSRARPRSSSPARSRSAAASARSARARMKGSVLELGGKDPQIVCADANLAERDLGRALGRLRQRRARPARASSASTWCARWPTASSTASCAGAERADASATRSSWDTEIGPMVSREQFELVSELVDDAVAAAPTLLCGGPRRGAGLAAATSSRPTVLTGVTHDMRIMREEIFGPGAADRRRSTPRTRRSSSPTTPSSASARRSGRSTAARASGSRAGSRPGMVWINDHMYSHGACQCSWGGVKDSGLGRSHSKFGFYECVNIKLRRLGAVAHARLLVAPLRRGARPGDPAPRRQLLYGRDADKPARAARRRAARCCKVGAAGSLRDAFEPPLGARSTPDGHARPGLRRQGMRLPAPQGDLRPDLRAGHARHAVLHRLPEADAAGAAWWSAAATSGSRRSRACSPATAT